MNAKDYLALLADGDLPAFRNLLRDELNAGEMTGNERISQVFDGFKPHDGQIGFLGVDNKMARTFGAALAVVPAARRREFFDVSLQEGLFELDVALCSAAEVGDLEIVDWLLEEGADPAPAVSKDDFLEHTKYGAHPLHMAALAGHVDVIRRLVEVGVPVDQPAEFAYELHDYFHLKEPSPLLFVTARLLAIRVDFRDEQWPATETLLELGADPLKETDGKPTSPLDVAVMSGSERLYGLLQRYSDVTVNDHAVAGADDESPLAALSRRVGLSVRGAPHAILWALDEGWKFSQDERGTSSAAKAISVLAGCSVGAGESSKLRGDELKEAIRAIVVDGGADPDAVTLGRRPVITELFKVPTAVGALTGCGADPDRSGTDGKTALFLALEEAAHLSYNQRGLTYGELDEAIEWVRALLESGADPDSQDNSQELLELALKAGDQRIIALLVAHGADLSGLTPGQQLQVYGAVGDPDAVAEILEVLGEPGVEKTGRFSAVGLALCAGCPQIAKTLVDAGLRIDHRELRLILSRCGPELSLETLDLLVGGLSADSTPEVVRPVIAEAIRQGRSDLAKRLLYGPYEPSSRSLRKTLTVAVEEDAFDLAVALVEHEDTPIHECSLAFRAAISHDNARMLELLVDRADALHLGDESAWCLAAENESIAVAEFLAERGLGDPGARRSSDGKTPMEIVTAKLQKRKDSHQRARYESLTQILEQQKASATDQGGGLLSTARARFARFTELIGGQGASSSDEAERVRSALKEWRRAMKTHRRPWPEWEALYDRFNDAEDLELAVVGGVEYLVHNDHDIAVAVPGSHDFGPDALLYEWFMPLVGADIEATDVAGGLLSVGGRYGAMKNPNKAGYPRIPPSARVPSGGLFVLQHNRHGTPVFVDRDDHVRIYEAATGEFEVVGTLGLFLRYCVAQLLDGRHWSHQGYEEQRDLDSYELTHVAFLE